MAKLTLTDEQRRQRSENMKRVRQEYYDKLPEEAKFAMRSSGGKNRKNPHKFTSETAAAAANARWNKTDGSQHIADAVAVDYPLGVDGSGHCLTERAGMILAGTGCTLVRTAVAKDIAPLVTDTLYHAVTMEPLDFEKADPNTVYGKHDIYMFREFKRRGYKVIRGDFDAWHYIVYSLGEAVNNHGSHSIRRRSFTD